MIDLEIDGTFAEMLETLVRYNDYVRTTTRNDFRLGSINLPEDLTEEGLLVEQGIARVAHPYNKHQIFTHIQKHRVSNEDRYFVKPVIFETYNEFLRFNYVLPFEVSPEWQKTYDRLCVYPKVVAFPKDGQVDF
jgi:hypothetical protein